VIRNKPPIIDASVVRMTGRVRMERIRLSTRRRGSEKILARAGSFRQQHATVPSHQIRTCARCGHRTTFMLEDAAGGWYSCVECGAYA